MKRDWKAILTDAQKRGLHPGAVAREQGCKSQHVTEAEARYDIPLPRKHPPMNPNGPHGKPVPYALFRKALIDGETANSFCLRMDICMATLKRIEAKHGVRLARGSATGRAA